MRPSARVLRFVALAIVTAWLPSHAADCDAIRREAPDPTTGLQRLVSSGCLGGKEDRDAEVTAMQVQIADIPTLDDADRWVETLHVTLGVERRVGKWAVDDHTDACRAEVERALASVEVALLGGAVVPESKSCGPMSSFAASCWTIDPNALVAPALPHCDVGSHKTAQSAEEFLRGVQVIHDALVGFSAPAVATYHTGASELRGRWWAYFRDTRMQYPWELAGNAKCFKRKLDEQPEVAFHEPPTHQLIYLHPGVAVEYLPDAPDGEQFKPGLSVELIGFNRWTWVDSSPKKAIGASIVANYSDIATIQDWRFGVALHVRHRYTLGATRGSGQTGWFVSADLAKLLENKGKKARAFIDKVKR